MWFHVLIKQVILWLLRSHVLPPLVVSIVLCQCECDVHVSRGIQRCSGCGGSDESRGGGCSDVCIFTVVSATISVNVKAVYWPILQISMQKLNSTLGVFLGTPHIDRTPFCTC